VDPVSDPLLLRKSGSAGNRSRTFGSVARNSDHQTTEAVKYRDFRIFEIECWIVMPLYFTGNTLLRERREES
jgi:hypothetical protein